jgi:hypothetical protein
VLGATGLGPEDVTMTAMTMHGRIAETVQYIAPEQNWPTGLKR